MSSILPKPLKYKDWLLWQDTAFDEMQYNRVDCSDTIEGICNKNISIEDCIEKSKDGVGCYIKFKNGDSICIPLKTDLYPSLNIVYKLRNKDIHPELKDVSVTTFVDTNKYSFPPENPNIMFYFDIFQLKNIESGLTFNTDNINSTYIEFNNNKNPTNLQIIPSTSFASQLVNYEAIKYGDKFNIILPGTTFVLSLNTNTNNFEWKESVTINQDFTFQFIPLDENDLYKKEKIGENISYGEHFTIITSYNIIFLNQYNNLEAEYVSLNYILERNDPMVRNTFSAISKMIGYYCEDDKCNPVAMSDTIPFNLEPKLLDKYDFNKNKIIDDDEVKKILEDKKNNKLDPEIDKLLKYYDYNLTSNQIIYKNATVGRDSNCWGACKYWDKNTNTIPPYENLQSIKLKNIDSNGEKNNTFVNIIIAITIILIIFLSIFIIYKLNK